MLKEELDKEIFPHVHLNGKELNELVKRYKLARNVEKKLAYRDEILVNVSKLIKKSIHSSRAIENHEEDDVFNSTVLGLYECLEHYKPNNNNGFITYFFYWIKKSIVNHCYSRNIVHIAHGAYSTSEKSRQRAERVGNSSLLQLDRPILHSDGTIGSLHEVLTSNDNPEETLFKNFETESLLKLLKNNLNPVEFVVIKYRYLNEESWKRHELQKMLNLSWEHIRQIEAKALYKLRKVFTNKSFLETGPYKNDNLVIPSEEEFEAHHEMVVAKFQEKG